MQKQYKNYGKPTDITENTFAFILGHLYAEATSYGKELYEEFITNENINKWVFIDFCTAFNALFNNTANLIENSKNEPFLTSIRAKFADMAQNGIPLQPKMPKCDGCMDLYNTFLDFMRLLQKSELMDLIKEANIFTDSGK
jgi:hypothetical protein